MKPTEELKLRTKRFAVRVFSLYRALPKTEEAKIVGKQILRSGTSIAANYRSACRARSRADFVSKMGITLEEADETAFWLELIEEVGIFRESKLRDLKKEANELIAIFIASIRTAKGSSSPI